MTSWSRFGVKVRLPSPRYHYRIFRNGVQVGYWTQQIANGTTSFADSGVTFTCVNDVTGDCEHLTADTASAAAIQGTTGYQALGG